jgi:hypothetical protein
MAKEVTTREKVPNEHEYCLRTAVDGVYMTKFRAVKGRPVPPVIVDPSYEKIMQVIRGEYEP